MICNIHAELESNENIHCSQIHEWNIVKPIPAFPDLKHIIEGLLLYMK